MSQSVRLNQTDWSIRLWAYDSAGAAVTGLLHNSAGMAVSVVVRSKGRIVSTTALTLVARSGAGVHTDSAWTEVADGEYLVDLADSYFATADRTISLTVAATAITGTVIVETLAVGQAVELDSASKDDIRSGLARTTDVETVGAAVGTARSDVLNAVAGLNNLSALANLYGSPLLEIPDSATTDFAFTLVTRDNEGKLVALDAAPTITAKNAAGTDRSSNLSAITVAATGRYEFKYSVSSTHQKESLRIICTGTVSTETRYVEWSGAVVDYDTLTTLNAVKTKVDLMDARIPLDPADQSQLEVYIDGAVASIQGSQQSAATAALIAYDPPTNTEMEARTLPSASYATATALNAVRTFVKKMFQLALRKDAGIATDNAAELTEINADGGNGVGSYSNTTDSQEGLRDRGDSGAWGGSGSSSNPELLLSTTIDTVTSQTVLVLADGTLENNAYKDVLVVITDAETATQKASVIASAYVGSSKTLTLESAPTFTVAAGDSVSILAVGKWTVAQKAQVDRIEDGVGSISGTPLQWTGNVSDGGAVHLTIGDDHVSVIGNQIDIPLVDVGGVKYAKMTAEGVTIQWGAGQDITGGKIIGEFVSASYEDGVTTAVIEVPDCKPTGNIRLPYVWQLQRTLGGKRETLYQGDLDVRFDMIETH